MNFPKKNPSVLHNPSLSKSNSSFTTISIHIPILFLYKNDIKKRLNRISISLKLYAIKKDPKPNTISTNRTFIILNYANRPMS